MERKVWGRTRGSDLFPNLYVILVAPPGVGKSNILSAAEHALRAIPNIFVAPSSLTTASLMDTVTLSKRQIITPGQLSPVLEFHSVQVVASELGVFLPAYDPSYMNALTKLYDGEHYEERRRTGKVNHLVIEHPLLSVLGGTTPSYLNSLLPPGAWDQGFTSRTIFVYSNENIKTDLWNDEAAEERIRRLGLDVITDLKLIAQVHGRFEYSDECKDALSTWDKAGLKPVPEHDKLTHYNSRRLSHCLKLCMVSSMARSNDLRITLGDFFTARGWLLEAEQHITDIFDTMAKSIDTPHINDTMFFIRRIFFKDHKPVSEALIYEYLRNRAPVNNIARIIEIMLKSGAITKTLVNGLACYIPG
jgi:hypothetical protein